VEDEFPTRQRTPILHLVDVAQPSRSAVTAVEVDVE